MLKTVTVLGALTAVAGSVSAAEPNPVVDPAVERREITVPAIDTEDFEAGVFAGALNVEDFGSSTVYGARLAYHITEDIFFEAVYGTSTVEDSAFRNLGAPQFASEEEDLGYYDFSVGYNLFPGEVFIGRNRAFTSAVYAIGGVGIVDFVSDDRRRENRFSGHFGMGLRVLLTDNIAVHIDTRDRMFETDILGEEKLTHNLELTGGLTAFF